MLLEFASLNFSEILHIVRKYYSARFVENRMSGKILVRAKMPEKVLKWPKKRLFRLFLEFALLVFSEILNIIRKCYSSHVGENRMSEKNIVRAKMTEKGLKWRKKQLFRLFLKVTGQKRKEEALSNRMKN